MIRRNSGNLPASFLTRMSPSFAAEMQSTKAQDAARIALQPHQRADYADIVKGEEIGEGAYAMVYRGTWKGRPVAVKEIKFEAAGTAEMEAFCGEVALMAQLQHPNIVEFLGACMEPSRMLIMMELVGGGDAMMLIARDDIRLDWRKRLSWLRDIASALHYLHTLTPKIIHRDVKTENILVDGKLEAAKLTDFGLAQLKRSNVASVPTITLGGSPAGSSSNKPAEKSLTSQPKLRHNVSMMRATSNMVIRPQLPARGSSLTRSLDCGALTAAGAGDTSSMSAPSSPITGSSSLESSGESPLGQSPPTLSAMSGRAAPNWAPSRQVAHRRLKSFDASSMDFSALSRRKQSIVVFDQETGTPAYVAPEIWRNLNYSEAIDVYALSIVMWEMVSREFAYDGMEADEIVEQVNIGQLRPGVPHWCPRSLRQLITQCWEDDFTLRPTIDRVEHRLETMLLECATWQAPINECPADNAEQEEEIVEEEVHEEEFVEEFVEGDHSTPRRIIPLADSADEELLSLIGVENRVGPNDSLEEELQFHLATATKPQVRVNDGEEEGVIEEVIEEVEEEEEEVIEEVVEEELVEEELVEEEVVQEEVVEEELVEEEVVQEEVVEEDVIEEVVQEEVPSIIIDGGKSAALPREEVPSVSEELIVPSSSAASTASSSLLEDKMVDEIIMEVIEDEVAAAHLAMPRREQEDEGEIFGGDILAPSLDPSVLDNVVDIFAVSESDPSSSTQVKNDVQSLFPSAFTAEQILQLAVPMEFQQQVRFADELCQNIVQFEVARSVSATQSLYQRCLEVWSLAVAKTDRISTRLCHLDTLLLYARFTLAHRQALSPGCVESIVAQLGEQKAVLESRLQGCPADCKVDIQNQLLRLQRTLEKIRSR